MYGKSLAHVERIKEVHPIEGADNIERVTVLDWNLVAKKGEFKPGELAVYVEIGSILPDGLEPADREQYANLAKIASEHRRRENAVKKAQEKGKPLPDFSGLDVLEPLEVVTKAMEEIQGRSKYPYFEFLRPMKFKIKTKVLNRFKVISQGILFRPDVLGIAPEEVKLGADFTERLGITEVVEDAEEAGVVETPKSGLFGWIDRKLMRFAIYRWLRKDTDKAEWLPFFPAKSDEENAQKIYSGMYEAHKDEWFVATEKLEGQSISICTRDERFLFFFHRKKLYVASRTRNLPYKSCKNMQFWKTVKRGEFDKRLAKVPGEWFIRGEHVGPGIQKNIYQLDQTDIRIYDVMPFNKETGRFDKRLNYEDTLKFCADHQFDYVPVIDDHFRLPADVQEMLRISNGKTVFGKDLKHAREGLVLRLRDNYSVSFKAKSPEYEL